MLLVRLRQAPCSTGGSDQVGAPSRSQRQRLLAPPAGDVGVVAREQHRGHQLLTIALTEHFRAAVVRAIEQTVLEAVLLVRLRVAEHAGLQPRDDLAPVVLVEVLEVPAW